MKLNADLVCAGLKRSYTVDIYGPRTKELRISRPEFYMDGSDVFEEDHLYLATVEHLPMRPRIGKNVVLVCVGDAAKLSYYKDRCCVMVIRNKADFFSVHRALEGIFERYNAWEQGLFRIFLESANVQEIADSLSGLLEEEIVVIDSSFTVLAHSVCGERSAGGPVALLDNNKLSPESISEYLKKGTMLLDRHGVITFDPPREGSPLLPVRLNIFSHDSIYYFINIKNQNPFRPNLFQTLDRTPKIRVIHDGVD